MATPLLKLDRVTKRYETASRTEPLTILDHVSLEVAAGDSVAIVGPSGSGKSTLLNVAGTLDFATEGQIWLEGRDLRGLDERALAQVRNRRIGFVFQSHYLLPQCTVLENVLVPTLAESSQASSREAARDHAERLLSRVGLGERRDHRPAELSGGERQRVAVVRALINQPSLLLADEPTGALDHAAAVSLGQLLVELNQEANIALIVVTHARELAARMSRVLELRDGRLMPVAS